MELRGIDKRYPSRPGTVLSALAFSLPRGGLAYVGGENGAGKTTLLRLIAGVIAPDRGTVRIVGLDPSKDRRTAQRAVGYSSAGNGGLHARLTVAQHLDVWARIAHVPKDRHRAAVAGALERFELTGLARQRADRISMGQRQRLRLAVALISEPDLVLLDEPTASLDAAGRTLLGGVLTEVTDRGGAVVWCSPDVSDVPVATSAAYLLARGGLHPLAETS